MPARCRVRGPSCARGTVSHQPDLRAVPRAIERRARTGTNPSPVAASRSTHLAGTQPSPLGDQPLTRALRRDPTAPTRRGNQSRCAARRRARRFARLIDRHGDESADSPEKAALHAQVPIRAARTLPALLVELHRRRQSDAPTPRRQLCAQIPRPTYARQSRWHAALDRRCPIPEWLSPMHLRGATATLDTAPPVSARVRRDLALKRDRVASRSLPPPRPDASRQATGVAGLAVPRNETRQSPTPCGRSRWLGSRRSARALRTARN